MRSFKWLLLFVAFSGLHLNARGTGETVIQNDFLRVVYDSATGGIDVYRRDGSLLIHDAGTSWNTNLGKAFCAGLETFRGKSVSVFEDEIGKGQMLRLSYEDERSLVRTEWLISLYNNVPGIVFETVLTHHGRGEINLKSIVPLELTGKASGYFRWPGAEKCITNGPMYYDPGMLQHLDSTFTRRNFYGETKGGVPVNQDLSGNPRTVQSWWNAGIFSGYDQDGLSLGYIENKTGMGRIQLLKQTPEKLLVVAESVLNPGFLLKSGRKIRSDRLLINFAGSPYQCLEEYADIMGRAGHARPGSIVNGWCNWFYTHDVYSEEEILENTRFIAEHLRGYGLQYIQIDEGFQIWHGDWRGNSRFPRGLKGLNAEIKKLGLKPGVWISPFVVSDTTALFKQHPDWFLKNADGSLKRIGPWPGVDTDWYRNEKPRRYGLDITHPQAEKWFKDLIDTLANRWGFEMIKVDFVAWTVFSADHFWDASATPAQVYSRAMDIMRKTAGEDCHILDCGPGNVSIGSINSMRIEYDQNYGYRKDVWTQYFRGPACSAGAMGKRYFFNNRTWTNDADHVCLDLLSDQQARAAASLISLSGGNLMSGDRLTWLDPGKIEILKKIFPAAHVNSMPVDLFDNDPQTSFIVPVSKTFDEWIVAGFFNPDLERPVEKRFSCDRMRLDPNKTYLVYDFWNEAFLGEIRGEIGLSVDPGGVRLVSIHEKKTFPQFISTTRHSLQGLVEIEDVFFEDSLNVLKGISLAPAGSRHDVIIYMPDGYSWSPVENKLFQDFGNFTIKMVDSKFLRIRLDFSGVERIEWEVRFRKRTKDDG
ncbi:alpha-galactosidase [bacterium]|nr:alpha-galactosidase [bacterium]